MRSIWKGAISFGLVTIPVKLYSATEERGVAFHQVHQEDGGRIRYKRVCTIDGAEVSYGDIAKGFETPTGEMVVLTDEDFADLPLVTSRAIDVLQFVPLEQVDPIYFAKSYYLEPEQAGTKPYVLLRRALEESGKVALVKVALRQRESLGTLRVRDGVFVLETMIWPDEVREPDFGFLDDDIDVRPQELQMAGSLIDTLSGDFDPTEYADNYREALQSLIEAKVAGHEVVPPADRPADSGAVVDLMAALRASVEAAKKGRAGTAQSPAAEPASSSGARVEESAPPKTARKAPPKPKSTGRKSVEDAAAGTGKRPAAAAKTTTRPKAAAAASRSRAKPEDATAKPRKAASARRSA